MHFTGDSSDDTEVEVKVVEAEHDMQMFLDMVLHESPRDQDFAYEPVADCKDERQHQQAATATAQASALAMALHHNTFVGLSGSSLGNHQRHNNDDDETGESDVLFCDRESSVEKEAAELGFVGQL